MTLVPEAGSPAASGATAAAHGRSAGRPYSVHPLRAEAVRGFGPWAGAAVLLTTGVLMAGSAGRWQGGWAETRTALHGALLILLPLTAAAGCWHGGREHRRGTGELWAGAARGPLAAFLVPALPFALWVAAGYAVATAGALLATWPFATGDRPRLDLMPVDTVVLAAVAAAGQVVGRVWTLRLAAPLVATAGYVVLGLAAQRGGSRFLDPVSHVGETVVPGVRQPVAMAVWVCGLAVAAVLAYAARRRCTALLPLAAAAAAGALLVQTGPGLWHTDPLVRHQVCDTSTTPQICVNARYSGLLPQVVHALSGVTGRLEGVRNLPLRFEDRPGRPGRDEAELPMLTPIGWSVVRGRLTDPDQYAWEAVSALQRKESCDSRDERLDRADDAMSHYLARRPVDDRLDAVDARGDAAHRAGLRQRRAARARLASMTADERRTWLSAYFGAVRACAPDQVPAL